MGPPRKDVIAPIGRTTGLITTRENRSPRSKISAPAMAEPGIK